MHNVLQDETLKFDFDVKHLGVTLDFKLRFNTHENIVHKALRCLINKFKMFNHVIVIYMTEQKVPFCRAKFKAQGVAEGFID